MKKYLKYLGNALTILSIYYLVTVLLKSSDQMEGLDLSVVSVLLLFLCTVLVFGTFMIAAYIWHYQLSEKYPGFKYSDAIRIIGRTQIAKYLPGNVAHFIGKGILAKSYGLESKDVLCSMGIENVLLVYSCLIISVGYFYYFDDLELNQYMSMLHIIVGVLALSIFVYVYLHKKYKLCDLSFTKLHTIILLNVLAFLIHGVCVYFIALILFDDVAVGYIAFVIGITVSFVMGFVVPGSPGGLGIREAVFVKLFAVHIGGAHALSIIIVYRIMTIIMDFAAYLLVTVLIKNNASSVIEKS